MAESRFLCTPGGAVARGRRRLRLLLLGAAIPMLGLAVAMFWIGRWGPGLISLGAGLLAWFTWHMSGDLEPLWLRLEDGVLVVQMRRQAARLELRQPRARRLEAQEREHLASLSSAAGVTFASASFESHRLGAFDLFATNLANAVLIDVQAPPGEEGDRDGIRWIVTPDDPDRFLGALGEPTAS